MKTKFFTITALLSLSGLVLANGVITQDLLKIAKERNLGTDELIAAAKTYTPAGKEDEFLCVNSGGQAASAILYGVPSMRIYKYIPTAAHDPVSGYMHEYQSKKLVRDVTIAPNQPYTWADTHHPNFSETDGKYDGRFIFMNDKANPRIFVIDMRDFETKQIVQNPIFMSAHGGAFTTPNTEYIVEGAQYPAPIDRKYVPLTQENFNEHYRGGITFYKFDNDAGKIDMKKSFTVLAPPYSQDLSDAGKGESYGYSFTNSFCSERHIGAGPDQKNPPFETGCSAKDTDFMHIVNWKKAEELVKKGNFIIVNNHKVIPMETAAKEGILFLVPERKSPHGNDVSPDGRFITVAGKLDTHASVYDFRKMKKLMDDKDFAGYDDYGIPILDMEKSLHSQVQIGLGPLHNQYGKEPGIVYSSLYLDSQIVKWSFLENKVLDKISVSYNIGHLVTMQGDSVEPAGKYVIALNKLALDRFDEVGPLLPQNHQLIDISGPKMKVIYDLPLPLGEPHYTTCIDTKKLKSIGAYPVGTDPLTMSASPLATRQGGEKIVRKGSKVEVFGTLSDKGMNPMKVSVNQGDEVLFHLTNTEQEVGKIFKFSVHGLGALGVFTPGKTATVRFVASQKGSYSFSSQDVTSPFSVKKFGLLTVEGNGKFEARRLKALKLKEDYVASLFKLPTIERVARDISHPGQEIFEEYGCHACHEFGKDMSAPDLTGVTQRRSTTWLRKWIKDPESMYTDPEVAPLIVKYGLEMPNLEVTDEHVEVLIDYLDKFRVQKE